MFNEKFIQGVLIFSGITIVLLIIPMLAYFITTMLTIPFMLLGSIIFGDEVSEIVVALISISIFLTILLYTEYRYLTSVSRSFFSKRLTKEGREKRDAKKAIKEKKIEGLFDIIETISDEK
jgi:Na+-transporting methylmalonyl-CoA/oxaloacetate decarboxylase gamma subunit